ncbi:hypothetical protein BGZ95_012171 [Linnemannia exigua]|uniref:Uncharacterized protein n=1 Tax=Linnemannia exigua TaxID=604196 RepID=A0AAD4D8V4_9FUNG|nr:hypothetical protein BGZ95_012171 [Linnemannia exigua]
MSTMLNSAVSDFSAKMSKHFHSNSVMPLSEANLSRHTLQSPASREAKLRHILVYVDLQRELIALAEEEEQHGGRTHHHRRSVREKKSATLHTNELARHPSEEEEGAISAVKGNNSSRSLQQLQEEQQHKQCQLRHHDSAAESLRQQRQHHQQQQERNTRQTDALDPSLALPRALPRSRIGYRDSYISVADLDTEWQIIDNVGPDSPTIPNSHYPAFEFALGHNESRHALPIQASKSGERPIQYRRREDSAEDVAIQRQPLQRQTSFEKEKKTGRFGRFSLPGRSKRASTSHQRKESLPEMSSKTGGGGVTDEEVHARSYSISNKDRVRFQEGAAVLDVDSGMNQSASMVKRRSKVRQLLSDIFKKTPKQTSQVISAPSPIRRAYPGSGHNILSSPSTTPQNLPPRAGTSLSHYARESMVDPLQRELYQTHTPPRTQERLILDDNNDDDNFNINSSNNNNHNDDLQDDADIHETPFMTQTSLTPPPAASVLRYSSSRPINLDQILSFQQGSAADDTSADLKTRPSSNLMPLAGAIKDLAVSTSAASGSPIDPYISQRRLVALTPEQPADLEGVGCRQNTFGMDSPGDLVLAPIATA